MTTKHPIASGFWKMRNGRKAWVAGKCSFHANAWAWVGSNETLPSACWTAEGRYCRVGAGHEFDLIEPWREPVRVSGWVNVYPPGSHLNESRLFYDTREEAVLMSAGQAVACVHVSGVEGEEP